MYKYRVDIALFLALGSDCREEEIIRQQGRTVLVLRYLLTLSITAIMKAKVLKHSGPFSVTKLGNSLFFFFFFGRSGTGDSSPLCGAVKHGDENVACAPAGFCS